MEGSKQMGISGRHSQVNRLLVLLIIGAVLATTQPGGGLWVLAAMVVLLPCAVGFGRMPTVHLALVFLAMELAPRLFPTVPPLLVAKASGILLYLAIVGAIPPLRRSLDLPAGGRIDGKSVALGAGIVALAAAGLILWQQFARPGRYEHLLWGGASFLPAYMVLFAVTNSLCEEVVWRGVMYRALEAAFGAGRITLIVQALSFGFAHFRGGFPAGWIGAGLASLFGLALGLLRRRTGGLLLPWMVHAGADFTIMLLVAGHSQ